MMIRRLMAARIVAIVEILKQREWDDDDDIGDCRSDSYVYSSARKFGVAL